MAAPLIPNYLLKGKIMRIKNIIIILGLVLVVFSCRKGLNPRKNESWKNKYSVKINEVLRIGSEELDDDSYVFSGINDIRMDSFDNIYVLDRKEFRIQKYSTLGKYIRSYILKKGQGPGEFQHPLFFDIGRKNNIFISDNSLSRITAIDQEGNFMNSITTRIRPGMISVEDDNSIYVTAGILGEGDLMIVKYHFLDRKPVTAFCEGNRIAKEMMRVGGVGEISKDTWGNIYFSFFVPYDIRKFSPQGGLIDRYAREIPFYKPPFINELGLPQADVVTKAICLFPDGKILHVIWDVSEKPPISYFDIFDQSGEWLISFDTKRYLKDWDGRLVRVGNESHIYLEFWRPFPHLRKYSIDFIRINKN